MYVKAHKVLKESKVGNLFDLKFQYDDFSFKFELINCLLIEIKNNSAVFLVERQFSTFKMNDNGVTLYAKEK
jgi:hypothetical protein